MSFSSAHIENIGENLTLHFLHFEEINSEIIDCIDRTIVSICSGPEYESDNLSQKRELKNLIMRKAGSSLELGHISEFFIHLYLNFKGFTQNCLYENLEEKGIKKGFDGYYSDEQFEWLIESKSGNILSRNISHKNKIAEAYHDLSKKISGENLDTHENPISPWKNAFYHARQANSTEGIKQKINTLSEEFNKGVFHEIVEFCIIPVSTIFFDDKIDPNNSVEDFNTVKEEILNWLNGKEIKAGHFICFSQKTKDLLLNYLNSVC